MQIKIIMLVPVLFGLSACLENDTQRGVVGAASGAVIAGAAGVDPVTDAVIGGAAGYFCKDLNVLGCRKN